jgi:MinD-like ATPase involved in chromosome partitioning or flagellar assembly
MSRIISIHSFRGGTGKSNTTANVAALLAAEGLRIGVVDTDIQSPGIHVLLDALLLDTHPGLNEETLLSIAMSNALAIVMRPDSQDYEGTSVTVAVARKLRVPRMVLVVNKMPEIFDAAEVEEHVEKTYDCEVAAVLPHSDELMVLSSAGIFALRHPDHPVTELYRQVASRIMS